MIEVIAHVAVTVVLGVSLLGIGRWIRRTDPAAAHLFYSGTLIRLVACLLLFWVSFLNLRFLRGIHSGDGFWEPDARTYYQMASLAARAGLGTIADWSASPTYVKMLALWFRLVGISPASGLLLNVFAYAWVCALLVGVGRSSRSRAGVLVTLAAITFSPALVLTGAEPLKDAVFNLLLVGMGVAVFIYLRFLPAVGYRRGLGAALALCVLIYLIAGIRPYVPFLVIVALAGATLSTFALTTWRRACRSVTAGLLTLTVLWVAFAYGSGPYYPYYASTVASAVGLGSPEARPQRALQTAREGFVQAGGATNIQRTTATASGRPLSLLERAMSVGFGLAVIIVPTAVLRAAHLIAMGSGRGLVPIIDCDTVYVDVSCAIALWFVCRRWHQVRGSIRFMVFASILSGVMFLLMAYVVTNLGTLFRLRLIPAVFVWLLPLATLQPREPPPSAEASFDASP